MCQFFLCDTLSPPRPVSVTWTASVASCVNGHAALELSELNARLSTQPVASPELGPGCGPPHSSVAPCDQGRDVQALLLIVSDSSPCTSPRLPGQELCSKALDSGHTRRGRRPPPQLRSLCLWEDPLLTTLNVQRPLSREEHAPDTGQRQGVRSLLVPKQRGLEL